MQWPAIWAMKSLGAAAIASTAACAWPRKWLKPAGVAQLADHRRVVGVGRRAVEGDEADAVFDGVFDRHDGS